MKLFITTMIILLVSLNTSAVETNITESKETDAKVKACISCHNKVINLKGRGVDTIIKQTKAIKSANKPHPPFGIEELCDEDIAVIADFLDKNNP
jgi:cytochrome c553